MIQPTLRPVKDAELACATESSPALKFSLILATVGRTSELRRFLEHLQKQSHQCFELIIVDQNADDRLLPLIESYKSNFPIVHCKSAIGLSRARNVGLPFASGDIVAYPDDDCWYSGDLLERVAELFLENPSLDCITGRPAGSSAHGFHTASGTVNKHNVFRRAISYTIFIRKRAAARVGKFDESLGLGTDSGKVAVEETDYLIRALSASCHIFYDAQLTVFHRDSLLVYDDVFIRRQYGSALAFGYVLRKYKYPFWFVFYHWLRPFCGACLALLTFRWRKARYHFAALSGRVTGWLHA